MKLLFLAIKTLLWRTKRKKGLFNWITLNSSLETYQNTIFYPSNCGDNKFWHPAVSIDFSWWKTNHGELFLLFLVSSSLIAFSDIEEQGKKLEMSEEASWHIWSYNSIERGFKFDRRPGGLINKEDNFGEYSYSDINQDHSCLFSTAFTTQHWFGAKYDA